MRFDDLVQARVVERVNRFAVLIDIKGDRVMAHLHDPGRLKEVVYPGNSILVRRVNGSGLRWRIEFGNVSGRYVLIDSGIHSEIARMFLPENTEAEVRVGRKRLDFRHDDDYIEVKGCTLAVNGMAMFPDAPTKRGLEHLETLEDLAESGYSSYILMLIMRDDVSCFYPNFMTDPDFSRKFLEIVPKKLRSHFLTFKFDGNYLRYSGEISMCSEKERIDALKC
ncbi:MAG: DNA/RNA nuclease SfsA [Thermoplasma sp.]|nr:MAG: DNA/RNA nuclease SfsA [Thermoplasma sp.]